MVQKGNKMGYVILLHLLVSPYDGGGTPCKITNLHEKKLSARAARGGGQHGDMDEEGRRCVE